MSIQTKSVLIALIISCFFSGPAHANNHLENEIGQLRKIKSITGSAVGFAARPGEFFELSKVFLQKGKKEDFLKLTSDENPAVRSMGIFCLAKHTKSAEKLKLHITDSSILYYCPGGCMVSRITVGNFVRNLLLNVNHLEYPKKPIVLISEDELIGLDIEILSKDSTTTFHDVSRQALSEAFAKKGISLITLSNLKEYAPNLEIYKIIKAIGRLDVSPRRKNFLISCLKNKNLDETSRLAAASALTHYPIKYAIDTLKKHRIYLNSIEQENWGDIFIETTRNRIAYENIIRPTQSKHTWRLYKNKNAINSVFSNSHPLALPDFNKNFSLLRRHDLDNARKSAKKSLIDISRSLGKYNQPWNTYSDSVYQLRFIVHVWREDGIFKNLFTEAQRIELESNIQNTINNHFEGKK